MEAVRPVAAPGLLAEERARLRELAAKATPRPYEVLRGQEPGVRGAFTDEVFIGVPSGVALWNERGAFDRPEDAAYLALAANLAPALDARLTEIETEIVEIAATLGVGPRGALYGARRVQTHRGRLARTWEETQAAIDPTGKDRDSWPDGATMPQAVAKLKCDRDDARRERDTAQAQLEVVEKVLEAGERPVLDVAEEMKRQRDDYLGRLRRIAAWLKCPCGVDNGPICEACAASVGAALEGIDPEPGKGEQS